MLSAVLVLFAVLGAAVAMHHDRVERNRIADEQAHDRALRSELDRQA